MNPIAFGRPTMKPHPGRRHAWLIGPTDTYCSMCGALLDAAAVKRGRNNRSRGNAIERDVAKQLGLRRVGQYGGPEDAGGADEPFVVQVKSGGAFSERYWGWLKALPARGQQTPLLVVTDAPGSAYKRRAIVVLDLTDWLALHGGTNND